jgi:hypothetical protein
MKKYSGTGDYVPARKQNLRGRFDRSQNWRLSIERRRFGVELPEGDLRNGDGVGSPARKRPAMSRVMDASW